MFHDMHFRAVVSLEVPIITSPDRPMHEETHLIKPRRTTRVRLARYAECISAFYYWGHPCSLTTQDETEKPLTGKANTNSLLPCMIRVARSMGHLFGALRYRISAQPIDGCGDRGGQEFRWIYAKWCLRS